MIQVVAGVICFNKQILLARRAPGQRMAGLWEFPGGKLEKAEEPEEALIREIDEEFGLEVIPERELLRYTHRYDFGDIELICVLARTDRTDLQLRVHDQVQWLELPRIRSLSLVPADIYLSDYLVSCYAPD